MMLQGIFLADGASDLPLDTWSGSAPTQGAPSL